MQSEYNDLKEKISILEQKNELLYAKLCSLEKNLTNYNERPQECFSNMAKYVVPKIRNYNYELLISDYKYNGITQRIIDYLDLLSASKFCWLSENNNLWLLYLQILLESSMYTSVEKIAERYLYFHKLKDIENFPHVANYYNERGETNEQIKKSAYVYHKLMQSEKDKDFERIVKNKRVAVVGNGPNELGKSKGAEIDAHDVVIRFSKGVTREYAEDYGSKTTIWVNTTANEKFKEYERVDYELSLWRFDAFYFREETGLDNIYSVTDKKCQAFGIDTAKYVWNVLGLNYILTTGCEFILHLCNTLGSLENVNFYGFHFLDEFDEQKLYFFSQKPYTKCSYHDLKTETILMKQIILEFGAKINAR